MSQTKTFTLTGDVWIGTCPACQGELRAQATANVTVKGIKFMTAADPSTHVQAMTGDRKVSIVAKPEIDVEPTHLHMDHRCQHAEEER